MNRFFVPSPDWKAECVTLREEESHHCSKVFRHKPGDEIEVFDGAGKSGVGTITLVSNRSVEVDLATQHFNPPLPVSITLIQAIPKAKTMDLVVQKAVEIGAARIIPVQTERTVVKLADEAKKQAKWQRIALESCKQCGRNWLPHVEMPTTLRDAAQRDDSALQLVAALTSETRTLRQISSELPGPILSLSVVIGPEGDFSPAEVKQMEEAGFLQLSLGPTVLRSETAAIYALSIVSQEFLLDGAP